jgi:hypothetical protein
MALYLLSFPLAEGGGPDWLSPCCLSSPSSLLPPVIHGCVWLSGSINGPESFQRWALTWELYVVLRSLVVLGPQMMPGNAEQGLLQG